MDNIEKSEEVVEKNEEQLNFEDKFKNKFGFTLDDYVSDSLEAENIARIRDVYKYSKERNLTMEQIRDEIKEKKCRLSSNNRLFASTYTAETLEKWTKEICEDKDGLRKLQKRLMKVVEETKKANG